MVGRQTSRGCATCRRRRVKCDEDRPACRQCVRIGLQCPGYAGRFVNNVANNRLGQGRGTQSLQSQLMTDATPIRLQSTMPFSTADTLRVEFIWKLESDALAARLAMVPITHVLRHVPRRIGLNRALDDAVTCVMRNVQTGQLYVTALESLRISLADPSRAHAPETLAAAAVLQMHEQYNNRQDQHWVRHARGVVDILKSKEPASITDELERAILEAEAVNVFNLSSTCFLKHSAWAQIPHMTSAAQMHLDLFVDIMMSGDCASDVEDLYPQLVSTCEKGQSLDRPHRERLVKVAIADFVRIRTQLKEKLFFELQIPVTPDAVTTVTCAAIEFFLVVADTILLGMYEQLKSINDRTSPFTVGDSAPQYLQAERSSTLGRVAERFKSIGPMSSDIRLAAAAGLRVILRAVLGSEGLTSSEVATMLFVLDQEIEHC